jgi:DNA invertase Pin-like site-specific DNA recombinase
MWAVARGYAVISEYSEVVSGLAVNMAAQARAIAQAESDDAALICTDPARLTRDVNRLIQIMADCEQRGIGVHFVKGQAT